MDQAVLTLRVLSPSTSLARKFPSSNQRGTTHIGCPGPNNILVSLRVPSSIKETNPKLHLCEESLHWLLMDFPASPYGMYSEEAYIVNIAKSHFKITGNSNLPKHHKVKGPWFLFKTSLCFSNLLPSWFLLIPYLIFFIPSLVRSFTMHYFPLSSDSPLEMSGSCVEDRFLSKVERWENLTFQLWYIPRNSEQPDLAPW